jgi:hypothetical protein
MKPGLLAALVTFALFVSAHAAPLVSNLSGTDGGNLSPQSTFWIAQRFDTASLRQRVTEATFRGSRHVNQTVSLELYAHDEGTNTPITGATALATFDATGVTSVIGLQTCAAIGEIILEANTSYWLVLKPSDVNTALWGLTDLGTPVGDGSIANRRATSNNGGTSWSGTSDWVSNLKFEIEATPVVPRPTLTVKGKRTIKTTRPVVKIRGTAASDTGVARVEYQSGKSGMGVAKGTTSWLIRLKPKSRKTKLFIRAVDTVGGVSASTRVVVIQTLR